MPASVPALALEVLGGFGVHDPASAAISLSVEDGGAIQVTLETEGQLLFVRPTQPLAVGRVHRLQSRTLCSPDDPGGQLDGGLYSTTFQVTDSAPLPTEAGTLRVASIETKTVPVFTTSGSCTEQHEAAEVGFEFEPAPAASPYLPVMSYLLELDGTAWATTRLGDVAAGQSGQLFVVSTCRRDLSVSGVSQGPEPGSYKATLVAKVAGSDQVTRSRPIDVEIRCGGAAGCGCSFGDAGAAAILALLVLRLLSRPTSTSASA